MGKLQARLTPQKKLAAIEKKQKARLARRNPTTRMKLTRDPGLPNMNPFKKQLLDNAAQSKRAHEVAARQRASREAKQMENRLSLAGLSARAAAAGSKYEREEEAREAVVAVGEVSTAAASNRRAYYRHLHKVVKDADVLLEVLDARDPLACRATEVERFILSKPNKRVILVLNKIDLVPAEVVQQWLLYLRRDFPTIAFKSSTQEQRSHLLFGEGARVSKAARYGEVVTGAGTAGGETLMQLIKNYSRVHDIKTSVTVGVIGYPNVGKSSIINSLCRERAVGVSATPGFTKTMQEVSLDSKVKLLDCPGIIFDDGDDASLALRNVLSVETMEDPVGAINAVLSRCPAGQLKDIYGIPDFTSPLDFLLAVAQKLGKVKKGGIFDLQAAAKSVLQDWNSGKIPFYTLPPVAVAAEAIESSIVPAWGKDFDVRALMAGDAAAMSGSRDMKAGGFFAVASRGARTGARLASALERGDDGDEDMGGGGGAGGGGGGGGGDLSDDDMEEEDARSGDSAGGDGGDAAGGSGGGGGGGDSFGGGGRWGRSAVAMLPVTSESDLFD